MAREAGRKGTIKQMKRTGAALYILPNVLLHHCQLTTLETTSWYSGQMVHRARTFHTLKIRVQKDPSTFRQICSFTHALLKSPS
jgi:hypothetical protein